VCGAGSARRTWKCLVGRKNRECRRPDRFAPTRHWK
jgi:hypothetical protein